MQVNHSTSQHLVQGRPVTQTTLTNNAGTSVTVLSLGGIVQSFKVLLQGRHLDIVLGFDDIQGYLSAYYQRNYTYFGAVVGRYANRIANGAYTYKGHKYNLSQNLGAHTLHGGFSGFNRQNFRVAGYGSSPQPYVTLQHISPAGTEGFPGRLTLTVTYTLTHTNQLIFRAEATTTADTPLSLTQHSYFNLSPVHGQNVGIHKLQINGNSILAQNADYCATGQLIPVSGTRHNFTSLRTLKAQGAGSADYDQTFVLNQRQPAAILQNFSGSLRLTVHTNQPVLHLYTSKYVNYIRGKGGVIYKPYCAVCLETSMYPNAVNQPQFPSAILKAGSRHVAQTTFTVAAL